MKQSYLKPARSKLERYIDILKVLADKGPLKLAYVENKVNINCRLLRESLDFLIKQRLVAEQTIKTGRQVFEITQRGIAVLKYFNEYPRRTSVIKEI